MRNSKILNIIIYFRILASLQRKPEDIDSFLILPKVIKADLFNKYSPKFKDRPKV